MADLQVHAMKSSQLSTFVAPQSPYDDYYYIFIEEALGQSKVEPEVNWDDI